ncbi:MAG: hypothetical protein CM15mV8_0940 [Caudoviricetes sp.]|nr:MAG: hypothetical protein CM15mV8_0940 [Caudoviricetes sp.]
MAFQVSTGVLVQERDLTRIILQYQLQSAIVDNSVKDFREIVSISSEQELVDTLVN